MPITAAKIELLTMGVATGGYVAAWLIYLFSLRSDGEANRSAAPVITLIAWAFHVVSLSVRGYRAGHLPIFNAFEFLSLFSAGVVLAHIIFERLSRRKDLGVALLPVALAILVYAWTLSRAVEPVIPIFRGFWLKIHILTALVAYSAFAATFGASLLYLIRKGSDEAPAAESQAGEKLLDDVARRAAIVGFCFLTVGIISGGIWAEYVWGRFWSWDPKETWSLITWLIFAAYIHTRYHRGWRGRKAALVAVIGFLAVMVTYLGVDLFMYRQHNFLFWRSP